MDVKPAYRTSDLCQLTRYNFLDECQIANALIENFGKGTLRVPARHPLLVSYWLLNLPARPRRGRYLLRSARGRIIKRQIGGNTTIEA
jgi:hypothetical protein